MNAKKIGISQPWSSRSMSSSLKEEVWIRKLIEGIFLNYNYPPSEIYIHFFPNKIEIKFSLFIPGGIVSGERGGDILEEHNWRLDKLLKLIKSIIVLKHNTNVLFNIKRIPHVFKNGKVLSVWLKNQIEKEPLRLLGTLRKVVKYRGKQKRF
jgi:hypothetical protein